MYLKFGMCFIAKVNDCMQQGPSIILKNKTTLRHSFQLHTAKSP